MVLRGTRLMEGRHENIPRVTVEDEDPKSWCDTGVGEEGGTVS